MVNLDYFAAEIAASILKNYPDASKPEKLDTISTAALNILQEQGIYAMFLWLKEKRHDFIINALDAFFHSENAPIKISGKLPEHSACQDLTRNLKYMFLAKQMIELILTYTRHMAKAAKAAQAEKE